MKRYGRVKGSISRTWILFCLPNWCWSIWSKETEDQLRIKWHIRQFHSFSGIIDNSRRYDKSHCTQSLFRTISRQGDLKSCDWVTDWLFRNMRLESLKAGLHFIESNFWLCHPWNCPKMKSRDRWKVSIQFCQPCQEFNQSFGSVQPQWHAGRMSGHYARHFIHPPTRGSRIEYT